MVKGKNKKSLSLKKSQKSPKGQEKALRYKTNQEQKEALRDKSPKGQQKDQRDNGSKRQEKAITDKIPIKGPLGQKKP